MKKTKLSLEAESYKKGIAFLFFQTTWSGSSWLVLNKLKSVLKERGLKDRLFVKDFEQEVHIAEYYGVYKIPTILLLNEGKAIGKLENMAGKKDIIHSIDAFKKMNKIYFSDTNS